jgi:hypothetical protein
MSANTQTQTIKYLTNKANALKGTIDAIKNMPTFAFISRYPDLSEMEFEQLQTRGRFHDERLAKLADDISDIKNKIRTKAEILSIPPNYNVQAVTALEEQLQKETKEGLSNIPASFDIYLQLKSDYVSRLEPLEFKLFRVTRKMKELSQIIREAEWYERYMAYAEEHAIEVDDENMYRLCNRHRISQLIEDEYGPKAQVAIDPEVDNCIGFIHSEDPEIFSNRQWTTNLTSNINLEETHLD